MQSLEGALRTELAATPGVTNPDPLVRVGTYVLGERSHIIRANMWNFRLQQGGFPRAQYREAEDLVLRTMHRWLRENPDVLAERIVDTSASTPPFSQIRYRLCAAGTLHGAGFLGRAVARSLAPH